MTASRNYSSTAGLMHLVGTITSGATSIVVDVTTGLPSVPYTLILDPGLGVEEVVEVTAIGGTTLTVTRGVDGTSAQSHTNGADVRHAYSARDFQDSRNHEGNVAAHGATGAVVGTTNTQTLTNKTLDGAANTFTNIPTAAVIGVLEPAVYTLITAGGVAVGAAGAVVATSPSITGNGTKVYKVTASWPMGASSTGDPYWLVVRETGGADKAACYVFKGTGFSGGSISTVVVPSAGSKTYELWAKFVNGTGTATNSATEPISIVVEQIA